MSLQQDLYKPDSNRLRRNLSGIINFAKFREEKLVPYTDMQESVEHLLEETAELEELNMRLVSNFCVSLILSVLTQHMTITRHVGPRTAFMLGFRMCSKNACLSYDLQDVVHTLAFALPHAAVLIFKCNPR